jgi:hypothetical protein
MANWIQRNVLQPLGFEPTVHVDPIIPIDRHIDFIPFGMGKIAYVDLNRSADYKKALEQCSPLAAIIMLCADAFSNGKFEVLNRTTQNYTRGVYKEWDRLLARPNMFQNRAQFLKQVYTYTTLNGYCYGLPIYASGFNDRPSSIWLLPPWCIEVELKDQQRKPYTYKTGEAIRKVFFVWEGTKTELKEEDLILFTDNSPNVDPCTWLPESRLKSLGYPISLFTSSEEAALTLIQKRGPMGIISNAMDDVLGSVNNPVEKEQLQQDLQRYGLTNQQFQYIITNQNLQWIPIGVNISELMLDENKLNAIKSMCFVLGYPFVLSPFSDQSTYENIKSAGKDLYQNTIVPGAQNIIEQLNEGLKTPEQNIEIIVSYEHLPAFQMSEKERGEGRKAMGDAAISEYKNNLITFNRALELLDEDTIPGGDYYYRDSPEQAQALDMQRLRFTNRNNNGQGQEAQSGQEGS